MMRKLLLAAIFLTCTTAATAQVAEFSVSGGVSSFSGALINNPEVTLGDGFRLNLRFTLNTYRFFGHEIGYAYNRSKAEIAGPEGGEIGMPVHQGTYAFLAYATPEGSRIRPFAAGGIHFSSFFPPGSSAYYGNQVTKFGFNYGGGIKARLTDVWGVRFDIRQYNTGKPDLFQTTEAPSGRLRQTEVSAGISFNL
ncbi:MAG TPA: outer membrane beta-barrel protein [Bryobacteraceae bacterium]|nr:outer membrane beta-barrel protein [Bryobacteraceae bacterium]